MECHQAAAGFALGPQLQQLNFPIVYPLTGRTGHQLDTLHGIGVLDAHNGPSPPSLVDYTDEAQTLDARARAYLHANCASCHRAGGPASFVADFRAETPLLEMGICDATPKAGDLGLNDARVLAPGAPNRSVLLERMRRVDSHLPVDQRAVRMPPLGVSMIDADGASLIEQWIASIASCAPSAP